MEHPLVVAHLRGPIELDLAGVSGHLLAGLAAGDFARAAPRAKLGHAGVAIDQGWRWLLYAADAYFFHGEMQKAPVCTPGLRFYQKLMEQDGGLRLANQRRLRELSLSAADVRVFCAHDSLELEALTGRSLRQPASLVPATV